MRCHLPNLGRRSSVSTLRQSSAIKRHQEQSSAIESKQEPSRAIKSHREQSSAITEGHLRSVHSHVCQLALEHVAVRHERDELREHTCGERAPWWALACWAVAALVTRETNSASTPVVFGLAYTTGAAGPALCPAAATASAWTRATTHSVAIRSRQRSSEVIRCRQRSSEVFRGHQRSSEALTWDWPSSKASKITEYLSFLPPG